MDPYRRSFIRSGAVAMVSAGLIRFASAATPPLLSESDPVAQALGYKANATDVNKAKFPQYVAGETCSSCSLYMGAAGAPYGPCPIYGGKAVSAAGWCSSYARKP